MKMADGFRPAYTMQIVSAVEGQLIVAVDVETSGSDRGLARPALERPWSRSAAPLEKGVPVSPTQAPTCRRLSKRR